MSTNTSTTREPLTNASGSAAEGDAGGLSGADLAAAMASLPDMSVIAKLANQFFTSLPGNPAPAGVASAPPDASVNEADLAANSGSPGVANAFASEAPAGIEPPPTPNPAFYFLNADRASPWSSPSIFPPADQMFALSNVTGLQPLVPAPSAVSSPPSEDNLRSAPASPMGSATVPASRVPTAAQPPGIPGSAANFLGVEKASLPADLSPVPDVGEMFSFPGVADLSSPVTPAAPISPTEAELRALPASLGTATALLPQLPDAGQQAPVPSSNHFLDRENSSPWNSVPAFPAGPEVFSLPGIPDLQSLPDTLAAARPAEDDLRALPDSLGHTNALSAHLPIRGVPSNPPLSPPYFLDAEKAASSAAALKPPKSGEMLAFPNVPGLQSLPGTPRVPTSPPTQADLRALLASPPGAAAFFTELPSTTKKSPDIAASAPAKPSDLTLGAVPGVTLSRPLFDPRMIRRDFPILREQVNGRPVVWLDNAATTQKPQSVIDRISYFYEHENSNIHRAAHTLAARATDAYESAREKVRRFLNAPSTREIVFVRGATEAINLAAQSWGRSHVGKDDEILISWLEHHSNIVPWQMLCAEKGAHLRVAPVDDDGQILLDEYEKLLNSRTRLVAITQVSNALGTILPVYEMVKMAHRRGARVLIDGAQSVAHMRVDVQALDCDFYVFSGHKIFAPTGIGVLYGKPDVLAESPPWQGGGSMIVDVTFEKSVYQQPPARFEAGTGNIADAVGLGAALDYLDQVGLENVTGYEHDLLTYGTEQLRTIPGLRLIGTAREKAGVMSFVLDGYRTEEVGAALNREGIAVRAGHHCAQPTLRRFGLETTVRPSLALYNTFEDIDALIAALRRLRPME